MNVGRWLLLIVTGIVVAFIIYFMLVRILGPGGVVVSVQDTAQTTLDSAQPLYG